MGKTEKEISAIVMCGGLATRMGGEPKYLLPVGEENRIIDLAIEPLTKVNAILGRVILASGKHQDEISDYEKNLSRKNININFCIFHSPPEGEFKAIMDTIGKYEINHSILVIHGDEVVPELDIERVWSHHKQSGKLITKVVTRECIGESSVLPVNSVDFVVQPKQTSESQMYYATGVIILSPEVISMAKYITDAHILMKHIIESGQIGVYIHHKSYNVNTRVDLEMLVKELVDNM